MSDPAPRGTGSEGGDEPGLTGRRVAVSGGTGFVGRAVVRLLLAARAEVTVLTRDPSRARASVPEGVALRACDLARAPGRPAGLDLALRGAEAVVHAARASSYDDEAAVAREEALTRTLLDAAIEASVRRFVHFSTASVYARPPAGTLDESSPWRAGGSAYVRAKQGAERLVLERGAALGAVVLQPVAVYGPGPSWWTGGLLDLMSRGRYPLVDGGAGLANLIHVEDLARAALLALRAPDATGQRFLVCDGRPVTWREYFTHLERILGRRATVERPLQEALARSRTLRDRSLRARARRWAARRLLRRELEWPLDDEGLLEQASRAVFDPSRVRERLGFQAQVDLERGMRDVGAWWRARGAQ